MKLIDEWKSAYKLFSVQMPVINTVFLATWSSLPQKFQDALPIQYVIAIAAALLVLGVAGRLVSQQKPESQKDDTEHDKV